MSKTTDSFTQAKLVKSQNIISYVIGNSKCQFSTIWFIKLYACNNFRLLHFLTMIDHIKWLKIFMKNVAFSFEFDVISSALGFWCVWFTFEKMIWNQFCKIVVFCHSLRKTLNFEKSKRTWFSIFTFFLQSNETRSKFWHTFFFHMKYEITRRMSDLCTYMESVISPRGESISGA